MKIRLESETEVHFKDEPKNIDLYFAGDFSVRKGLWMTWCELGDEDSPEKIISSAKQLTSFANLIKMFPKLDWETYPENTYCYYKAYISNKEMKRLLKMKKYM